MYAAFKSLNSFEIFMSLSTFFSTCFNSLSISPCLGSNLYAALLRSTTLSKDCGGMKSFNCGIHISGSKTCSSAPVSIPGIGFGFNTLAYFVVMRSIPLSSTSSPLSIEDLGLKPLLKGFGGVGLT